MSHYTLNKYISRLMAVLLALVLLIGAVPVALADGESGSIGDNLNWSLSAGVLTITGSGEMVDIPELERAPWHELRKEICQVVLPEGLTSIGDMAFYECERLQSVVIPDSVTRIGSFAFAYCRNLELLNLGSGVVSIEECAFTDCYRLASLQLPTSLKTIGKKAFYRCESIAAVTIPSSVTSLGVAAFGYCKNMVTADVQAQITEIPSLLFYGCELLNSVKLPDSTESVGYRTFLDCDNLDTVYYNGSNQTPDQIQDSIGMDVPDFSEQGKVTEGTPDNYVVSGTVNEGDDENIIYDSTSVNQGKDATVTTQVQQTETQNGQTGNTVTNITVTITGDSGWKEAIDGVNDAIHASDSITENGSNASAHISVYVKNTDTIDQEFIDNLAGQDVEVTVMTQDGSIWRIKGTDLDAENDEQTYDMRYQLIPGSDELCQELGTNCCFAVKFQEDAVINAELMMQVGIGLSMQNATLLQRDKEITRIQSSVVDNNGYAHFFIGSVDSKTEYFIAMNLQDVHEALVPQELSAAYGAPQYMEPIKYEITGRKSSWGMTMGQVTWILAGVMAGCVVVTGFVMYILNKRRLRMGYVPDLDDEDLTDY